ncbi:MAG: hypothetical protein V1649_01470 [Patescibacteria group bacterium]
MKINTKLKIIIWGILSEAAYLSFWFVKFINQNKIYNNSILIKITIVLIILLLLYYYQYRVIAQKQKIFPARLVIFFIILFALTYLFLPPIGSNDVYVYISQSHILTTFKQNPYLHTISEYPNIRFYKQAQDWKKMPLTYGPIWVYLTAATNLLSFGSPWLNLLLAKIIELISYFIIGYLLYKIGKYYKHKKPVLLAYLWLANPLVLFEIINNGHNDGVMLALLLASFYFFLKNKNIKAIIMFELSVLIKFAPLVLAPVLLVYLIKKSNSQNAKQKIIVLTKFAIFGLLVLILSYFPFWSGKNTFLGLYIQLTLLSSTSIMSPLPFLLSLGGINNFFIKPFCRIIFIILTLVIARYFMLDKDEINLNLSKYWSYTIIVFFATSVFWFTAWYVLWIFPFLLISLLDQKNKQQSLELLMLFSLIGLLDCVLPMSYLLLLLPTVYFFFKFFLGENYFHGLKLKQ